MIGIPHYSSKFQQFIIVYPYLHTSKFQNCENNCLVQCGPPQLCLMVYKSHEYCSYLRIINHSEIGVICTHQLSELSKTGAHIVLSMGYENLGHPHLRDPRPHVLWELTISDAESSLEISWVSNMGHEWTQKLYNVRPPSYKLVYKPPVTIVISTINIVIGVICTNLAILGASHCSYFTLQSFQSGGQEIWAMHKKSTHEMWLEPQDQVVAICG